MTVSVSPGVFSRYFTIISLIISSFLLSACISEQGERCLQITDNAAYCFVPDPIPVRSETQMVRIEGPGIKELSLFQLESDGQTFHAVALSPIGQSLMSVAWNGQFLQAESVFGERVTRHARRLMMLIQWLKWPEEKVLQGFRGVFVEWRHEEKDGVRIRRLIVDDRMLLQEETKADGERVVTFPGLGVRLFIQNLDG